LHELRAAESPDFNYLIEQIERTRTLRERELLPLNEEIVKADRERLRRIEFDAENLRRELKGLELNEWVEQEDLYDDDELAATEVTNGSVLSGSEEAIDLASNNTPDNNLESVADEVEEEKEVDPLLLESGRVLADFINLSKVDLSARL